jgi:hypothetical protein
MGAGVGARALRGADARGGFFCPVSPREESASVDTDESIGEDTWRRTSTSAWLEG